MTTEFFQIVLWGWIGFALLLVPIQLRVTAPYGRHTRRNWGPMIDNRLGWILMEIVSPLVFAYFFLSGEQEKTAPMWIIFALWMAHYLHRSLIFPLRLQTRGKRMPLSIAASAAFFNVANGFFNGYYLGYLSLPYPLSWLSDPRFLLGLALFLSGAAINLWADNRLINLRRRSGTGGYRIPRGGFFRYVSCPNHFGEIVEWTGFAILCWNLPALSFAVWTAANLIPRALSHHRWYHAHFPNYPPERRAVIPGLL